MEVPVRSSVKEKTQINLREQYPRHITIQKVEIDKIYIPCCTGLII